jgi:ATPase MipZ
MSSPSGWAFAASTALPSVVYREFFPRRLTALDDLDEMTLGTWPNMSHVIAARR